MWVGRIFLVFILILVEGWVGGNLDIKTQAAANSNVDNDKDIF